MEEQDEGDPSIKLELVMQGWELLLVCEVMEELIPHHPTVSNAFKLSLQRE